MRKQPIMVHRKQEHEMTQAIKDLEAKGYRVIHGPIQRNGNGKVFTKDSYGRAIFQQNTINSVWICKLERVVE